MMKCFYCYENNTKNHNGHKISLIFFEQHHLKVKNDGFGVKFSYKTLL